MLQRVEERSGEDWTSYKIFYFLLQPRIETISQTFIFTVLSQPLNINLGVTKDPKDRIDYYRKVILARDDLSPYHKIVCVSSLKCCWYDDITPRG